MKKTKSLLFIGIFTIAGTLSSFHQSTAQDTIDEPVTKAKDWLCLFGGKKCFRTVY